MLFEGICTALVTPFLPNGKVDYKSLKNLVISQKNSGIKTFCVLGSTGEPCSLSTAEKSKIIRLVKSQLNPDCKLIVGANNNNPSVVIKNCQRAAMLGADACLVSPPYYNKCTQSGIVQFYNKICSNTSLPIVVYNVPSRTALNILPSTMQQIAKIKNVVALKEANGDIGHIMDMFASLPQFDIYCGNDELLPVFKSLGASGAISVLSNAFPRKCLLAWQSGKPNWPQYFISKFLFCEPNPIPIKFVLSQQGKIYNVLRPPLTPLEPNHQQSLATILKQSLYKK